MPSHPAPTQTQPDQTKPNRTKPPFLSRIVSTLATSDPAISIHLVPAQTLPYPPTLSFSQSSTRTPPSRAYPTQTSPYRTTLIFPRLYHDSYRTPHRYRTHLDKPRPHYFYTSAPPPCGSILNRNHQPHRRRGWLHIREHSTPDHRSTDHHGTTK
jgi:hypothetical protein